VLVAPAVPVAPPIPPMPAVPVDPVSAPVLFVAPPVPVAVVLVLDVVVLDEVASPVPAAPVPVEDWLEQPDPAATHARTIRVQAMEARPIHRGGETRRAFICTMLLTGQAGVAWKPRAPSARASGERRS